MTRASFLRLERDGGVARIILGRPAAGNAMTLQFCRELQSAAEACADDAAVHERAAELDATAVMADISDAEAVRAALSGLERIDVLVNNAGLERMTPVTSHGARLL